MANLEVSVGNRPYQIACAPEDMERVKALVTAIDDQVSEFQARNPEAGQSQLILMAALTVLDDARAVAENAASRLVALEARVADLRAKAAS